MTRSDRPGGGVDDPAAADDEAALLVGALGAVGMAWIIWPSALWVGALA